VGCSEWFEKSCKILKTYDGGNSWDEIIISGYSYIRDLKFINDSTGYFIVDVSNYSYFCVTSDTFNTWNIIYKSVPDIESYFILDEKTIFAIMGDSLRWGGSNVLLSRNGGFSWANIQNAGAGLPDKIYFSSSQVGYLKSQAFGSTILEKSIDSGANWIKQIFSYPFTDVWFIDNNIGFASGGWFESCFHCSFPIGNVFVTNDGGMTWKNHLETGYVQTCYFLNDAIGYLLVLNPGPPGWATDVDGVLPTISKTTDFGENWVDIYEHNRDSTGCRFSGGDLFFMNEQLGWIIGSFTSNNWDTSGAAILGTLDGGENWDLVWKYPNTDVYEYYLNSIHATDTTAWAVGGNGLIVKYTAQDKWQPITRVTDLPLSNVFFSDEDHGWIAGGYFYEYYEYLILLKTTDGGETWQKIPEFKYQINDMFFEDSLHGWVVGNDTSFSGMILETSDGGDTWNIQVDNLSAPLNAIHFKDGYGWAVGGNGLVLRTDGINWINQNTGKTYPSKFSLSQNYPNPFNPITMINYKLPMTSDVELSIYNLLGQKVATLVDEKQNAGDYQLEWDASGFASGIYYYQLISGDYRDVKKMILLR
jgi:photosystem II stability/assembly factor-like uncharacterized protein